MNITQEFINSVNEQTKDPNNTVLTWNFISSQSCDERLVDLMFGPFEKMDKFILIEPNWIMAHIVHAAGAFQSVGEAKKNGWNKPIPPGLNAIVVGELPHPKG